MNTFEIYFGDLTSDAQARLVEFLGGDNGNYDVFPICVFEKEDFEEE